MAAVSLPPVLRSVPDSSVSSDDTCGGAVAAPQHCLPRLKGSASSTLAGGTLASKRNAGGAAYLAASRSPLSPPHTIKPRSLHRRLEGHPLAVSVKPDVGKRSYMEEATTSMSSSCPSLPDMQATLLTNRKAAAGIRRILDHQLEDVAGRLSNVQTRQRDLMVKRLDMKHWAKLDPQFRDALQECFDRRDAYLSAAHAVAMARGLPTAMAQDTAEGATRSSLKSGGHQSLLSREVGSSREKRPTSLGSNSKSNNHEVGVPAERQLYYVDLVQAGPTARDEETEEIRTEIWDHTRMLSHGAEQQEDSNALDHMQSEERQGEPIALEEEEEEAEVAPDPDEVPIAADVVDASSAVLPADIAEEICSVGESGQPAPLEEVNEENGDELVREDPASSTTPPRHSSAEPEASNHVDERSLLIASPEPPGETSRCEDEKESGLGPAEDRVDSQEAGLATQESSLPFSGDDEGQNPLATASDDAVTPPAAIASEETLDSEQKLDDEQHTEADLAASTEMAAATDEEPVSISSFAAAQGIHTEDDVEGGGTSALQVSENGDTSSVEASRAGVVEDEETAEHSLAAPAEDFAEVSIGTSAITGAEDEAIEEVLRTTSSRGSSSPSEVAFGMLDRLVNDSVNMLSYSSKKSCELAASGVVEKLVDDSVHVLASRPTLSSLWGVEGMDRPSTVEWLGSAKSSYTEIPVAKIVCEAVPANQEVETSLARALINTWYAAADRSRTEDPTPVYIVRLLMRLTSEPETTSHTAASKSEEGVQAQTGKPMDVSQDTSSLVGQEQEQQQSPLPIEVEEPTASDNRQQPNASELEESPVDKEAEGDGCDGDSAKGTAAEPAEIQQQAQPLEEGQLAQEEEQKGQEENQEEQQQEKETKDQRNMQKEEHEEHKGEREEEKLREPEEEKEQKEDGFSRASSPASGTAASHSPRVSIDMAVAENQQQEAEGGDRPRRSRLLNNLYQTRSTTRSFWETEEPVGFLTTTEAVEALDEEYAAAIQRAVDAFDDKVGSSDVNDMPTLCGALRMIGFRYVDKKLALEIIDRDYGGKIHLKASHLAAFAKTYREILKGRCLKLFQDADADESHSVSASELAKMLRSMSIMHLPGVVEDVIRMVAGGMHGAISFNQFLRIYDVLGPTRGFHSDEYERIMSFCHGSAALNGRSTRARLRLFLQWFGVPQTSIIDEIVASVGEEVVEDDFLEAACKYREKEAFDVQSVFSETDTDYSGLVEAGQIKGILTELGYKMVLPEVIDEVMTDAHLAYRKELLFEEVCLIVQKFRERHGLMRDELEEVLGTFNEHAKANPGFLTCTEFVTALNWLGFSGSLEEFYLLFNECDTEDTDFLGKQEFVLAAVRCYLRDFFGALEAFETCDLDKDGYLSSQEVRIAFLNFKYMPKMQRMAVSKTEGVLDHRLDKLQFAQLIARHRNNARKEIRRNQGYTDEQVKHFKTQFQRYCIPGQQEISGQALDGLVTDLSQRIFHKLHEEDADCSEAKAMLEVADPDQTGQLTFIAYLKLMKLLDDLQVADKVNREKSVVRSTGFSASEVSELRKVFHQFDKDNSQELEPAELQAMISKVLPLEDTEGLRELSSHFKAVDVHTNNMLDFSEFLALIKRLQDTNWRNINGRAAASLHEGTAGAIARPGQIDVAS